MPDAPLVTISASYGAGGSLIGPRVAARLRVAFLDRAIPTEVSSQLSIPLDEALAHEESPPSLIDRLIARLASSGQAVAGAPVPTEVLSPDDQALLAATEAVLHSHAAEGGVVLGRAAAVVLRDVAHALHVRLDGPVDRRLVQAMREKGMDRETAQTELPHADHSREAYVREYYGVDARDPSLYHVILDSTALALDACVEIIAGAAASRVSGAHASAE